MAEDRGESRDHRRERARARSDRRAEPDARGVRRGAAARGRGEGLRGARRRRRRRRAAAAVGAVAASSRARSCSASAAAASSCASTRRRTMRARPDQGRRCPTRCRTCCRCPSTRRCSTSTRSPKRTGRSRPARRRRVGDDRGAHRDGGQGEAHVERVDLVPFGLARVTQRVGARARGRRDRPHRRPHDLRRRSPSTACRGSCASSPPRCRTAATEAPHDRRGARGATPSRSPS